MKILKSRKIDDNFYLLSEEAGPALVTMGLVIGEDRAALVDSGCGITGTLDKFVKSITNKPIVHLVSHCDPDHGGASALFDNIYMSNLDDNLMPVMLPFKKRVRDICVAAGNKAFLVKLYLYMHMTRAEHFAHQDIKDGDIFKLGGIELEAFAMPGHTKGSMCFVNRKGRYAISSDSIIIRGMAVVGSHRCAPLNIYRAALARFIESGFGEYKIYTGHSYDPVDKGTITELITACDDILSGETQGDEPYQPLFADKDNPEETLLHKRGHVGVQYLPDNLF
jgi:glyoxylase-like metal-dependent hydrolase (beta-lactamase superfamily II)